jgi:hypothetical protein
MVELLGNLNSYANLVTAAATAVLAILTGVLWIENRSLRKAGSAPEVVAYLLPHPDGHGGVHFVLANVGRGPAFNVTFDLDYDEDDFKAHRVMLLNDPQRSPISVLPQDEKIRALIGISFQLYGKIGPNDIGPLMPFKVRITFYNVVGRKINRKRVIDIRQFAGLHGVLEKSNERKISEALEKLEKQMTLIAKQSSRFSAFVDITKIGDARMQKSKGNPD